MKSKSTPKRLQRRLLTDYETHPVNSVTLLIRVHVFMQVALGYIFSSGRME